MLQKNVLTEMNMMNVFRYFQALHMKTSFQTIDDHFCMLLTIRPLFATSHLSVMGTLILTEVSHELANALSCIERIFS